MKKTLRYRIKEVAQFVTRDVWLLDANTLSRGRQRAIRYLKAIIITFKGLEHSMIGPQATFLAFLSFIALVPIIAFIYAFARALGYAKMLEEFLYRNLEGLKELVDSVLGFAQNIINKSHNGIMGLIGALTFFWSIVWLINRIEKTFNNIWQVKSNRNLSHRTLMYLMVLVAIPIVVVLMLLFTVSYTTAVERLPIAAYYISYIKPYVGWLAFGLFMVAMLLCEYRFIPGIKVKFWPSFNAAVVTGIALIAVLIGYIELQLGLARLSTVYGALAAVPLIMVLLNIIWNIVLFGAMLSYGFQNIDLYEFDRQATTASIKQQQAAALMVTRQCAMRMKNAQPPLSIEDLAEDLQLPIRMINTAVNILCKTNILIEVRHPQKPDTALYQPAVDINKLTVSYVIRKLDNAGDMAVTHKMRKEMKQVLDLLEKAETAFSASADNKLLTQI